ncbi:hypothetical protein QBC32DRAFT_369131 [Pseudoneurospora amorphoporcata]|uniref:protein-tyrosine-phosphatase n=1 Tax=Pseudoneurospora amorphoporcata TaxID=241081 RepID=A0AAN6NXL7_9PEZI|nr:hypothetical protein QBC32DRAFT_369131 [Pseudoneurospora amorphoporcata]
MPPPPASPIGHGSSSEHRPSRRRKSSSSSTRSSGPATVPTMSVPAPTYSQNSPHPMHHHRSFSNGSRHSPYPPLYHHRSSSGTSQHDRRSPSPGSSSTNTFVLPPGVSISQITPDIFVGNNASSTSIQTLMHYGITSMVSLLSTAEQRLNEEAWNSPALDMLVPKPNRLFVRCEDSPEEDLVGRLAMICEFVDDQIEGGGPGQRRRKRSVEEVLESVLPASELPKGFNVGQEPERKQEPRQRVRSLIPDEDGRVEGPHTTPPTPTVTPAKGAEDMAELTRQKSAPPQRQRVRSLIPDDVEPAGSGRPATRRPKPIPSLPSGSIPYVPSAPVPSLPGQGQSRRQSSQSQLSALSPSGQASPSSTIPTSPSNASLAADTGGKVLIHCNQGVSRSGAACVAYMMKQHPEWSAAKALRFVQSRRKEVEPSENFMGQLKIWGECGFCVWEDVSGEGLEVDGKSIDGKGKGKGKKVPKRPYKKWLCKREEVRRRVREMGGLVLSADGRV